MKKPIGLKVVKWVTIITLLIVFGVKAYFWARTESNLRKFMPNTTQAAEPATQHVPTCHYGFITLGAEYGDSISVEPGQCFIAETAENDIEVWELLNGETEFPPVNTPPMEFSLEHKVPDYLIPGQTSSFAFKAATVESIDKVMVYAIYDKGYILPKDWHDRALAHRAQCLQLGHM